MVVESLEKYLLIMIEITLLKHNGYKLVKNIYIIVVKNNNIYIFIIIVI